MAAALNDVRVGVPLDGPVPIVSSTIGTAHRASVGRSARRLPERLTIRHGVRTTSVCAHNAPVSVRFTGTERFDPASRDVSGFSSGNELLDRRLVRYAGQNQRRDATRTFVAPREGLAYGYYTLVAGQLEYAEATLETRKGLSRHMRGRDSNPRPSAYELPATSA